tara:strand:- start:528 stop:734 length:207 start_codon:yes stop_codon:yes gene_type:complete
MNEKPDPVIYLVVITLLCMTVAFIFQPDRNNPKLEDEVKSLRDDVNQLTVIVSELDKPVIVVDGKVAE